MKQITLELTDTEFMALEWVTPDILEWVQNAAANRARIASEDIIALLVTHCNKSQIALAVGADAQILQAYELGIVKKATEVAAAPLPGQE
jgi:hypothetical protein